MIISASRRTDIPAFYTPWFLKRLRAGYCTVPNPYNSSIVSTISLRPEDVDLIVFWTRNPRPLMPHLAELDREGYYYYFLITVLDYPRAIDTQGPALKASLKTFQKLTDQPPASNFTCERLLRLPRRCEDTLTSARSAWSPSTQNCRNACKS